MLAGGTILVPEIARTGGADRILVDIAGLPQLREITFAQDVAELGSAVTVETIAHHPRIQQELTALGQAAAAIGNPQVRRAATPGGNVAVAAGTSDLCPALLSLDAEIFSTSSQGPVQIPFSNFLSSKQFITSVRIKLVAGRKSAFRKFAWRHASGITIASVSVAVVMQGATVASARIAVGGVSAKPVLLLKAGAALQGQSSSQETIQEISRQAASEAPCDLPDPPAAEYRRRLVLAGMREALGEVLANA